MPFRPRVIVFQQVPKGICKVISNAIPKKLIFKGISKFSFQLINVLLLVLYFHLKLKLPIFTFSLYLVYLAEEEIKIILGTANGWQEDKNTGQKKLL